MAITLEDLRTFCAEIASPDSSGTTADREFMHWINGALQRLYSEAAWDRILHQSKLTILPLETITDLGVTAGSLAVTSAGNNIAAKYLSERWELHIGDEGDEVFELAARASAMAATLRAGDEWTGSTGTKTAYAVKTIYPLPNTAKSIERVQVLETNLEVAVLPGGELDYEKTHNPTERGSYPRVCTYRKGNIEIWPHPGTEYCKLALTYRKGPTLHEDADADATEVDWDEEWRDLLLKAITLEASITQGENAPIPYPIALREYEARLGAYKGLNANKDPKTGPLGVRTPERSTRFGTPSFSWDGTLS